MVMTMDERMYYKDNLKKLEDEITNLSSNLTPSLSDEILLVEKKIEFEKILIEIEIKQNKTVSKSTEEELLYLIEKERILKETKGFILQKKLD
mgnify:FL=1